jgi:hypothetical protein
MVSSSKTAIWETETSQEIPVLAGMVLILGTVFKQDAVELLDVILRRSDSLVLLENHNVRLALPIVRPDRYGELRRASLKLRANEPVGDCHARLKYGGADHAVFDDVCAKFFGNDYVRNLCLSHVADLESK